MVSRSGGGWGHKTNDDRKREDLKKKIEELSEAVKAQERHILNRGTIRGVDFNEMVRLKTKLRSDDNELQILKRKLIKMEETWK